MELARFSEKIDQLRHEAKKALVGQDKALDLLLTSLFAGGHSLIEGVPGIAKTLSAKLLAQMVQTAFKRIQFTPDLMPSDILGTSVFNLKEKDFEYKKGPIFANIVLIDEINRAPAKTQAALFEVMEEQQVTNDGTVYAFESPFMVVATQNPIEQEGTYRLPEAQLDRFMFKVSMDYPSPEEEEKILKLYNTQSNFKKLAFIENVISKDEVVSIQRYIESIHVKDDLITYISKLVAETRSDATLFLGASPRASLDLMRGSKAFAAINGREFITPEDIQFLFRPVIEHRIQLTPEAELQGITLGEVSQQIIQRIEVPK